MNTNYILNNLMKIARQPALIFATRIEEKPDNALETLKFLSEEKHVTASMIAEHLDIKPSSVTHLIKKLEEIGAVKRIKSEKDARVSFLELTDIGRETMDNQVDGSLELKEELFKEFTEEEITHFAEYLNRLNETISSEEFNEKVTEVFGDDERWKHFGRMSAHFGRARKKMLRRSGHDPFGHYHGFEGYFGRNPFEESFAEFDRRKKKQHKGGNGERG